MSFSPPDAAATSALQELDEFVLMHARGEFGVKTHTLPNCQQYFMQAFEQFVKESRSPILFQYIGAPIFSSYLLGAKTQKQNTLGMRPDNRLENIPPTMACMLCIEAQMQGVQFSENHLDLTRNMIGDPKLTPENQAESFTKMANLVNEAIVESQRIMATDEDMIENLPAVFCMLKRLPISSDVLIYAAAKLEKLPTYNNLETLKMKLDDQECKTDRDALATAVLMLKFYQKAMLLAPDMVLVQDIMLQYAFLEDDPEYIHYRKSKMNPNKFQPMHCSKLREDIEDLLRSVKEVYDILLLKPGVSAGGSKKKRSGAARVIRKNTISSNKKTSSKQTNKSSKIGSKSSKSSKNSKKG